MNTLTKQAIGLAPGDTIIIQDHSHSTGPLTADLRVEQVYLSNDRVYVSGIFGVVDFPKYTGVVVKF